MKKTALILTTMEALLTSIDQGGAEVPMDRAAVSGDTLVVESAALVLRMEGVLDLENGTWETEFKQGPGEFPLTMRKVERLPDLNRP